MPPLRLLIYDTASYYTSLIYVSYAYNIFLTYATDPYDVFVIYAAAALHHPHHLCQ